MTTQGAGSAGNGPILVIDDDVDQRTGLAELLACAGYEVVVAGDGQDALDLLSGGLRPVVIVLDLTMPRMDGWVFLERLRGSVRSTVPVLVTSALATDRPPTGADACMEKPLDVAAFSSLVGRLFAAAHAAPAGGSSQDRGAGTPRSAGGGA